MASSVIKGNKLSRLETRWYNTGSNTSVLTDIETDRAFAVVAVILPSGDSISIEGCGKRFETGAFVTTTNMFSESNGYVLFNPDRQASRVMMIVYRGTPDGNTR